MEINNTQTEQRRGILYYKTRTKSLHPLLPFHNSLYSINLSGSNQFRNSRAICNQDDEPSVSTTVFRVSSTPSNDGIPSSPQRSFHMETTTRFSFSDFLGYRFIMESILQAAQGRRRRWDCVFATNKFIVRSRGSTESLPATEWSSSSTTVKYPLSTESLSTNSGTTIIRRPFTCSDASVLRLS